MTEKSCKFKAGMLVQDIGHCQWYRVTGEQVQKYLSPEIGETRQLWHLYNDARRNAVTIVLRDPVGLLVKKRSTTGRRRSKFLLILHPEHGLLLRKVDNFTTLTKV